MKMLNSFPPFLTWFNYTREVCLVCLVALVHEHDDVLGLVCTKVHDENTWLVNLGVYETNAHLLNFVYIKVM